MKTQLSYPMGDGHIVKEAQKTNILGLIQAYLYASFGGFSIREILEDGRI
jgi:hypothetical protein